MSTDKEYEFVVTVNEGVDWQEIHTELTRDTGSETVPDRTVDVRKLRSTNTRNTHYNLTITEANALKNDPRVMAVELKRKSRKRLEQNSWFDNSWLSENGNANWGLLRHIKESPINPSETNGFSNSFPDRLKDYDYVLDGTGVDVVIQDTGIKADHPEWKDPSGNSRLKQIDWFSSSGVAGNMPSDHYTDDSSGHGTHVASIAAGRRCGWAKNADIYVQTVEASEKSSTMSDADAMDTLLGWHQNKGTGRPTVVNMSWGYFTFVVDIPVGAHYYDPELDDAWPITGVNWRNNFYSTTTMSGLQNYGTPRNYFSEDIPGYDMTAHFYQTPFRSTALDTDIQQLINAGIIVCIAAGNSKMKQDVSGGVDYNNHLVVPDYPLYSGRAYYHRGSSPNIGSNPGFNVGALSSNAYNYSSQFDKKATFSDSGPAVNIYAVGDGVLAAASKGYHRTYQSFQRYQDEPGFFYIKHEGTSMASPQMAGMSACLLQAHPDWSPKQVQNFFDYHATPSISTTGNDNDYNDSQSLHGGQQKVAYFPMHGKTTHNWKSK